MKAHDLARALLAGPDLAVGLHVKGHTYMSEAHKTSHGPLHSGIATYGREEYVVIGDMLEYAQYPTVTSIRRLESL